MDDSFHGSESAEKTYGALHDHILPRLAWSKFKLSFKKLILFMEEISALGMIHKVGGISTTKYDRTEKIKSFSVPRDVTAVRSFLATIQITRKWIKNFAEISRPLARLTGKVPWKWEAPEQLSYDILKKEACRVVEMHGFDWRSPCRLYTDASGYGAGCVITQFQNLETSASKAVEVPILFDSFLFTGPQMNYGTYKRELLAIVEFWRKYHYYFRSVEPSEIITDHKPLTTFLRTQAEGIYAHWQMEMISLNISIKYIDGKRNKVADALS
ncbi:hypothetical protein K3495_g4596 [Podosphaera aphanis]|nr:hypothetical protein K3495_g4596 [Podosphaera aphanis]